MKDGTATYGTAGLGRPAAGKTGTSEQNASAWFSGYTPQLAASVALFRDDATQSLNGIGGLNSVTGGTFPAKIWTAFMKGALKGEPILQFPKPTNIGGTDPVIMTTPGSNPVTSPPTASPTPSITPTKKATAKATPTPTKR